MNIAISGVGKRVQLIRMAVETLYDDQIVCADSSQSAPALTEGNSFTIVPRASASNFKQKVIQVSRDLKIDFWLSIIDTELVHLWGIKEECSEKFILPNLVNPCMDKLQTSYMCDQLSIDYPITSLYPLDCFPQVIKDRFGSAASGFHIINDSNLLKYVNPNSSIIYQEYLEGTHLDIDFYVDIIDRDIKSIVARKVTQKKSGETYKASFIDVNPQIKLILNKISDYLGLKGPNNVDFICQDNRIYLLDINPRFGGNYPATHTVGHNYWKALKQNFMGLANDKMKPYENKLVMNKYFYIELKRENIENQ